MKIKKIKIILFLFIVLTIILITTMITINSNKSNTEIAYNNKSNIETDYYKGLPVEYRSGSYLDVSTPKKAIGASEYVFIAKINSILRTEYRYPTEIADGLRTKTVSDPYTIYSVTVIENIKGNLIKTIDIEVEQMGGMAEDNKSYSFLEDTGLLNIGEYYILLACVPFEKELAEINIPGTFIPLGKITESDTLEIITDIARAEDISIIKNIINNSLETSKADSEIIQKVSEYTEAYFNQTVSENIKVHNKSVYDILYNQ